MTSLYTKSGLKIAKNYNRIEKNRRNESYYEIDKNDMIYESMHIPEKSIWKLDKKYNKLEDYIEFRTNKDNIKIYYQIGIMLSRSYANYKIGYFYVNTKDIVKETNTLLKYNKKSSKKCPICKEKMIFDELSDQWECCNEECDWAMDDE